MDGRVAGLHRSPDAEVHAPAGQGCRSASGLLLRILKHLYARERLSRKHRERGPAAGRDMGHPVSKPEPGHRVSGRTPTGDRGAVEVGEGCSDPAGSFCKLRDLKDPIRPFQTTVRRPASS